MKIKIHKKTKYILLVVLITVIFLSALQSYRTLIKKDIKSEELTTYQCTYEPQANYQVFIKKNPVYEGDVLGEDIDYSTRLLDYIEVAFATEFKGNVPTDLKIQYEINAVVQGYKITDKEKTVNWSKVFPLVEKNTINLNDVRWNYEQAIKVSLDKYDKFATKAEEITGMDLYNEVRIEMTGSIDAYTQDGDISVPINSNITVPLRAEIFTITKSDLTTIQNQVTTNQESVIPVNIQEVGMYITLAAAAILGMVFLFFFTSKPTTNDLINSKVKKIIKNHGSRIVAVQHNNNMIFKQTYEVNSIEDMVKTADEIQKPIFYVKDESQIKDRFMFYLIDDEILYTYAVTV